MLRHFYFVRHRKEHQPQQTIGSTTKKEGTAAVPLVETAAQRDHRHERAPLALMKEPKEPREPGRDAVREPRTPQVQPSATFLPLTPLNISRRPSLQNTTCSSSSSLYEMNMNVDDLVGPVGVNSSAVNSCVESSDDDTDDDMELAQTWPSARRSNELFREHYGMSSIKSPSVFKHRGDDHHDTESTPIFKRLVNKSVLKPQLKAFRRITSELQTENVPLDNEINHEKLVLLNLENKEHYLSPSLMKKNNKTIEQNNSSYKKFDIIKRANESWNMRKNSNASSNEHEEQEFQEVSQRKRSFDESESTKFKRRAVSSSPISANLFKRGNVKLISKASEELEGMSLDSS